MNRLHFRKYIGKVFLLMLKILLKVKYLLSLVLLNKDPKLRKTITENLKSKWFTNTDHNTFNKKSSNKNNITISMI